MCHKQITIFLNIEKDKASWSRYPEFLKKNAEDSLYSHFFSNIPSARKSFSQWLRVRKDQFFQDA